jgi:Ribbon-helix-helix protein, copG family.
MEQITLRVPEDTLAALDEEADEHSDSRSKYIRDVLDSRNEHTENMDDMREQIDALETELERVRNEKRLILEQREEKNELARFAEQERTARERREQRRAAPAWRRAKWWVFGAPDGEGKTVRDG